jgi:signal transduction histidine kinase
VSRAGLRLRITALAAAVLATGLAVGALALAVLFAHARVATVDERLDAEARVLVELAATGQLPAPLPGPPGLAAQVVDPSGAVLAASAGTSRVVPLLGDPPTPPRRLTTRTAGTGGERLRVEVRSAGPGGPVVVVALPLTDVDEAVDALQRVVLLLVPVVVVAAAAATWLAVGSALRPVERLRGAADEVVGVGGPAPPALPVPATGDELQRLGETLNRMLARLHSADERQRAFVADAAHELRSPLAAALTQLEVALDAPPADEDWPAVARDVLVDIGRLRVLVDDLLLLARLDGGAPRSPEPVDLSSYADDHPDDHAGPPVPVVADRAALDRAVGNLVGNAARHARSRVRVTAAAEGAEAVLRVEDDGAGIAPGDRERVFDRWTRLDDGRGRDEGGSGLGLAIARAVVAAEGGRVVVEDSPLGGAALVVRLPLATPGSDPAGRFRRG